MKEGHVMKQGRHAVGQGRHAVMKEGHVKQGGHAMGQGGHTVMKEGHAVEQRGCHTMEQGGHAVGKGGFQGPNTQWGFLVPRSKPSWCDLTLHGWPCWLGQAVMCHCTEPSQQPA